MTAHVKNNMTTRLRNQHKKLMQNPQQVVGPLATCGRAQRGEGLNILFRFSINSVVLNLAAPQREAGAWLSHYHAMSVPSLLPVSNLLLILFLGNP